MRIYTRYFIWLIEVRFIINLEAILFLYPIFTQQEHTAAL